MSSEIQVRMSLHHVSFFPKVQVFTGHQGGRIKINADKGSHGILDRPCLIL